MYQATCDYCGRVHSSKKLETLPQTCNSCHAVLPAPEWIDDDETNIDDIKDAVREVLDERDKKSEKNSKSQTHILPSEPKYTKDEEELKRISSELFDKCSDLTRKICHTVSDSIKPVEDAIEKTKCFSDENVNSACLSDMSFIWFIIKSILGISIGLGMLFLLFKTDRLNPLCGIFILIMSIVLSFNIPLPLINKKKLTQEAKDRYQAARTNLNSWLKDYDISEKQVIRFMSDHKSTIRKSLITDTKTGMSQARDDINKELKMHTDELLEEWISRIFHQRRFERILAFSISLAIFLLVFPISSIERKVTPVTEKKIVCTLSSKDLNDNSIIVADEKGREKKFYYRRNSELFQEYVTGDTIEIYVSEYRDGRVEYHIGESSLENNYTLLSPAEETTGE